MPQLLSRVFRLEGGIRVLRGDFSVKIRAKYIWLVAVDALVNRRQWKDVYSSLSRCERNVRLLVIHKLKWRFNPVGNGVHRLGYRDQST